MTTKAKPKPESSLRQNLVISVALDARIQRFEDAQPVPVNRSALYRQAIEEKLDREGY